MTQWIGFSALMALPDEADTTVFMNRLFQDVGTRVRAGNGTLVGTETTYGETEPGSWGQYAMVIAGMRDQPRFMALVIAAMNVLTIYETRGGDSLLLRSTMERLRAAWQSLVESVAEGGDGDK